MGIFECTFIVTEHSLNLLTRMDFWQSYCVCSGLASVEWLLIRPSFSDLLPADSPCCVNQTRDMELVQISYV